LLSRFMFIGISAPSHCSKTDSREPKSGIANLTLLHGLDPSKT
jgi:hypothetical protein